MVYAQGGGGGGGGAGAAACEIENAWPAIVSVVLRAVLDVF